MINITKTILFIISCVFSNLIFPQNIYTIAGTGILGNGGDGGLATQAQFGVATGIVIDKKGNIIFCDWLYGTIRKVDKSGIITTIAGGGASISDFIPATSSGPQKAWGLTIDSIGNLYFGEGGYNRVRKIDTNGIITTIAGVANTTGAFSGDGGLAINASLNYPTDVALDRHGNIFIVDSKNHRIRKVNKNGIISTFAGSGIGFFGDGGLALSALFNTPMGIAIDRRENIYLGDSQNGRIRKIDTSGVINTIAGDGTLPCAGDGGLAVNAQIGGVLGMIADSLGNLFFGDRYCGNVRKIDTSEIIDRVAGNGTSNPTYSGEGGLALSAQLHTPTDVTFDVCGNMFITDGSRVFKICYPASCTCYLDIQDLHLDNKIKIFPNPAYNYLNLELIGLNLEGSHVEITNLLGKKVKQSVYANKIDVSDLNNGIYTLQLFTNGAIATEKLVIQR